MEKLIGSIAASSLFQGLSAEETRELASHFQERRVWKDEVLVMEGDECSSIGLIVSGQVALHKYARSGDYVLVDVLGPTGIIGEDRILSTNPVYSLTIEAASNARIAWLPKSKLLQAMEQHPRIRQNLVRNLSGKVQHANNRINMLSQRNLRRKIGVFLLELAKREEEGEPLAEGADSPSARPVTPSVDLPGSKEMVARMMAIPRPSLSRELVHMERDKLIMVSGRVIWLTDLPGLEGLQDESEEDFEEE